MDFSKSIYIKENEYLDGRSIVMFDCDTPFHWTKETNQFLITHIIKLLNKSIYLSEKHCGHEEFSVMVNLKNIKKCKLNVKYLLYMTRILKELFPDKLYKCFLKNPSVLFRSIYLVIRIAIDKETRSKISMIKNGDYMNYDATL